MKAVLTLEEISRKDVWTPGEAHRMGYSQYEIKRLLDLTNPDGSNRHFLKDAVRFVGESMDIRYDKVELKKAFAKRASEVYSARMSVKDFSAKTLGKRY
jgi:hypothetical protein